jgi:hypothetical protein
MIRIHEAWSESKDRTLILHLDTQKPYPKMTQMEDGFVCVHLRHLRIVVSGSHVKWGVDYDPPMTMI